MSFWNSFFNKINDFGLPEQRQPSSDYSDGTIYSNWYPVSTHSFDGEKTFGELGAPINLLPEHRGLRLRAYEAQLKSDVVKIITGKFFKWIIGNGLKLQSEPSEIVLKELGYNEDFVKFRRQSEARFKVYSESKLSDYSGMENLHKRAREAHRTAFLSGDCLCVLRVENQNVNIQVIDGSEIETPILSNQFIKEAEARGNRIKHGIEIDKKNQHVAFYVKTEATDFKLTYERIEARNSQTGDVMAWMIYGDKHRSNHLRGIPVVSAILEKVEKLDRYTEASVAGAEERAKIVYTIEHNINSNGENPLLNQIKNQISGKKDEQDLDPYKEAGLLSKKIAATTNKQTFNMPVGAKMSSFSSDQEDQYDGFFNAVFVQLCAAIDIPPEVALQKYSSNYSASRAAINGWGFVVDVNRKDFSWDFYKNFYTLWLKTEVLKGNIKSPGLMKAILQKDEFLIECFCGSKFTGVNMPHIDPLKEVKAIREMLGDQSKGQLPLISHERASEELGQGEWADNFMKWEQEVSSSGIEIAPKEETTTETDKTKKDEPTKN